MDGDLKGAASVVIKVGTSSLMAADGVSLDMRVMEALVEDIVGLMSQGKKIVLVTSGAVGLGKINKGEVVQGRDVQVAARVGQPKLMNEYIRLFEKWGRQVGQLLLTNEEFREEKVGDKVVRPIEEDFKGGVLTIINENDAITDKQTTMGDNDWLAAKVAVAIKADRLVMLSVNRESAGGKGGSDAKEKAMEHAEENGITTLLVDGKRPHIIRDTCNGDSSGRQNARAFLEAARDRRRTAVKAKA